MFGAGRLLAGDVMADNSLDSLVEWMKTGNPLRGWGMVVALQRAVANQLLLHEHTSHFGGAAQLPAVSGDIPGFDAMQKQRLSGCLVGAPHLSFEASHLSAGKVNLSLPVIGGSYQAWEKKPNYSWLMTRMAFYDPLQGPSLSMQLPLADEPATVVSSPSVSLDLSNGEDYRLSFADSAEAQALGGAYLETLLKALDTPQVEYVLGRVRASEGGPRVPERFKLTAQGRWAPDSPAPGSDTGDGALLALIQFEGDEPGSSPGIDDYHYLIPDSEADEYCATVLFDRASGPVLPGGEIILELLFKLLGGDESNFDIQRTEGELIKATATGGTVQIAESATRLVPLKVDGQWVQAIAYTPAVNISAAGATPLTLARLSEGKYSLKWKSPEQTATSVIKFDRGYPDQQRQAPYAIELDAVFEQVEQEDGSLLFGATTFKSKGPQLPGTRLHEQHRPGGIEAITPYLMLSLIHYGTVRLDAAVRSGLSLVAETRRGADDLIDSANEMIRGVIELNGDTQVQAQVVKFPRDVVCVGGTRPGTFTVSPQAPRIQAGATHLFTAAPAVTGLSWAVANAGPDGGPAGEIDSSTGMYTAPEAADIPGPYTWVRVTATAAGVSHSALASVVVEALSVSPLFTRCAHDSGPIVLRAGQAGAGELVWAISNADPAQCGTLQDHGDGTCSYQPHPLISGALSVVDQVTVRAGTGAECKAVVVVEHNPNLDIAVSAVREDDLGQRYVELEAYQSRHLVYAPQWSVELGGPGHIGTHGDQWVGHYVPDVNATDRFVLIKVTCPPEFSVPQEAGMRYVALPLPLANFVEQLPPHR